MYAAVSAFILLNDFFSPFKSLISIANRKSLRHLDLLKNSPYRNASRWRIPGLELWLSGATRQGHPFGGDVGGLNGWHTATKIKGVCFSCACILDYDSWHGMNIWKCKKIPCQWIFFKQVFSAWKRTEELRIILSFLFSRKDTYGTLSPWTQRCPPLTLFGSTPWMIFWGKNGIEFRTEKNIWYVSKLLYKYIITCIYIYTYPGFHQHENHENNVWPNFDD